MNYNIVTYVKMVLDAVEPTYTDHYEVFEHLPDAHKRYNELVEEDDTWSANVSRVIRSTDYEMPVTRWNMETKPLKMKEWKDRGIASPNQVRSKGVSCEL